MNGPAISSPAWRGTITLVPMGAIFAGAGGDTPVHCHLAHKIVVGAAAVGPPERLRDGRGAVAVPAGAPHQVLAAGRPVVLAYLDARRFRWQDAERLAERWRRLSPGGAVEPLLDDVASSSTWAADERALAVVEGLARGHTLGEVSEQLRLSESRVTHLVTEQLGAPPRAWRTWIRLREAIDLLGDGETVTGAAHAAGFADSSHFSRSCSSALGIAPSALRGSRIDRTRLERCAFG
jgi:AraC-like DNA-binding protein